MFFTADKFQIRQKQGDTNKAIRQAASALQNELLQLDEEGRASRIVFMLLLV